MRLVWSLSGCRKALIVLSRLFLGLRLWVFIRVRVWVVGLARYVSRTGFAVNVQESTQRQHHARCTLVECSSDFLLMQKQHVTYPQVNSPDSPDSHNPPYYIVLYSESEKSACRRIRELDLIKIPTPRKVSIHSRCSVFTSFTYDLNGVAGLSSGLQSQGDRVSGLRVLGLSGFDSTVTVRWLQGVQVSVVRFQHREAVSRAGICTVEFRV